MVFKQDSESVQLIRKRGELHVCFQVINENLTLCCKFYSYDGNRSDFWLCDQSLRKSFEQEWPRFELFCELLELDVVHHRYDDDPWVRWFLCEDDLGTGDHFLCLHCGRIHGVDDGSYDSRITWDKPTGEQGDYTNRAIGVKKVDAEKSRTNFDDHG